MLRGLNSDVMKDEMQSDLHCSVEASFLSWDFNKTELPVLTQDEEISKNIQEGVTAHRETSSSGRENKMKVSILQWWKENCYEVRGRKDKTTILYWNMKVRLDFLCTGIYWRVLSAFLQFQFIKMCSRVLERWPNGKEGLLLCQRTRVCFPSLITIILQTPVTPAPRCGNGRSLSGHWKHSHTHVHINTHTNTNKSFKNVL